MEEDDDLRLESLSFEIGKVLGLEEESSTVPRLKNLGILSDFWK